MHWLLGGFMTAQALFRTEGDRVAATAVGATLSRNHPRSVHGVACFWLEAQYLPFSALLHTLHTLRTGQTAADHYLGEPFIGWITATPERAALLSRGTAAVTAGLKAELLAGHHLPDGAVVADIGGADGSVLVDLLGRHPDRRGIVFDLPTVVPAARDNVAAHGLADRVEVVAGDFFATVPAADVYLLSTVLHDRDDSSCRTILAGIAAAARPGAALLVIEGLIPPGDAPAMSKLSDQAMLGMAPGRERTAAAFTALLADAGCTVESVRGGEPYGVITARLP